MAMLAQLPAWRGCFKCNACLSDLEEVKAAEVTLPLPCGGFLCFPLKPKAGWDGCSAEPARHRSTGRSWQPSSRTTQGLPPLQGWMLVPFPSLWFPDCPLRGLWSARGSCLWGFSRPLTSPLVSGTFADDLGLSWCHQPCAKVIGKWK